MGIFLNLAYLTVALLGSPWILYSRWRRKKSLGNLSHKFWGELPLPQNDNPRIWLHAVSVGEVIQLQPIVRRLAERFPQHSLVITTTTTTGHSVAREKYGTEHTVCYFPFDFTWSVRRALRRINPSLIVLVELELWPNFIRLAHQASIPVALINGRITEKSWKRYRLIRPLLRSLLARLSSIQVQNPSYADRLIDLGADPQKVEVTGSIKFDGVRCDRTTNAVREIRNSFGILPDEQVFIAGSTQAPEEALAIDCYRELKSSFPRLRLVLVPRHTDRFEEVARLVQESGLPLLRRTEVRESAAVSPASLSSQPVLLLDTLGELSAAWGLADIAFVGGSFGSRGGQNMIEPAGYGACVFFGPNTWNFRDASQLLLENSASVLIPAPDRFTPLIRKYLKDTDLARQIGLQAQKTVLSQQGAALKTLNRLQQLLDPRVETPAAAA